MSEEPDRCVLCLGDKIEPVTIDCGHSFCDSCWKVYRSYTGRCSYAQSCPICRATLKEFVGFGSASEDVALPNFTRRLAALRNMTMSTAISIGILHGSGVLPSGQTPTRDFNNNLYFGPPRLMATRRTGEASTSTATTTSTDASTDTATDTATDASTDASTGTATDVSSAASTSAATRTATAAVTAPATSTSSVRELFWSYVMGGDASQPETSSPAIEPPVTDAIMEYDEDFFHPVGADADDDYDGDDDEDHDEYVLELEQDAENAESDDDDEAMVDGNPVPAVDNSQDASPEAVVELGAMQSQSDTSFLQYLSRVLFSGNLMVSSDDDDGDQTADELSAAGIDVEQVDG